MLTFSLFSTICNSLILLKLYLIYTIKGQKICIVFAKIYHLFMIYIAIVNTSENDSTERFKQEVFLRRLVSFNEQTSFMSASSLYLIAFKCFISNNNVVYLNDRCLLVNFARKLLRCRTKSYIIPIILKIRRLRFHCCGKH